MRKFAFSASVWEYEGQGAWHFVSLPGAVADDIRAVAGPARGFGSVRVEVTIGDTRWRTSVFPDSKSGTYVLPVKKSVRHAEGLEAGTTASVEVTLIDE